MLENGSNFSSGPTAFQTGDAYIVAQSFSNLREYARIIRVNAPKTIHSEHYKNSNTDQIKSEKRIIKFLKTAKGRSNSFGDLMHLVERFDFDKYELVRIREILTEYTFDEPEKYFKIRLYSAADEILNEWGIKSIASGERSRNWDIGRRKTFRARDLIAHILKEFMVGFHSESDAIRSMQHGQYYTDKHYRAIQTEIGFLRNKATVVREVVRFILFDIAPNNKVPKHRIRQLGDANITQSSLHTRVSQGFEKNSFDFTFRFFMKRRILKFEKDAEYPRDHRNFIVGKSRSDLIAECVGESYAKFRDSAQPRL